MTGIIYKEEDLSDMFNAVAVFNKVWLFQFCLFVSLQNDLLEVLKFVLNTKKVKLLV